MKLKLNRALCATTALASGLILASSAFAQSTATQVQELVVTGARGQPSVAGVITQVREAKEPIPCENCRRYIYYAQAVAPVA